jgi:hypothetical protein
MKYADGGLLAPNGRKSNLTPEQYELVRTPEFKAWFGDWEDNPENASKVVDTNGEPLIVWHTTDKDFNVFSTKKSKEGFFFSPNKERLSVYGKSKLFSFFLSIKNPSNELFKTDIKYLTNKGYDGIMDYGYAEKINEQLYEIICFYPEQIKLADGTNTTFDSSNPDIRYAKGGLLAPNGKPSNLTPEQYKLVRTPEFKAWFGDWENNPESASKVVDENGEPLVVYHGTDAEFYVFNKKFIGSNFKLDKIGFFFTSNYDSANMSRPNYPQKSKYKWSEEDKNKAVSGFIIQSFINLRNPLKISEIDNVIYNSGVSAINTFDHNRDLISEYIIKLNKDGFLLKKEGQYLIVAIESNQIKLADGTNTTFDGSNPDIRYADGGDVDENKETYKKWKSLVNMSKSELENFYNSQEGKDAGLSASEARSQGIDSGRESARWIMRMKDTPKADWTPEMWKWAKKQISFISRMSGNKGSLYDDKGRKTRKHTSLLIWGHNPKKSSMKYEKGGAFGEIEFDKEFTNQQLWDFTQEYGNNVYSINGKIVSDRNKGWSDTEYSPREFFDLLKYSGVLVGFIDKKPIKYYKVGMPSNPSISFNIADYSNFKKSDFLASIKKAYEKKTIDYSDYITYENLIENNDFKMLPISDFINKKMKSGGMTEKDMNKFEIEAIKLSNKYKLPYEFIEQQLSDGIEIEHEHTDSEKEAMKIALDHLNENPNYYIKLKEMEIELEETPYDAYLDRIMPIYKNGGEIDQIYSFITPTGKPSKLNYIQQILVRTKQFKSWFGDWEVAAQKYVAGNFDNFREAYKNCSIVIHYDTLEPSVEYHGTNFKEEFYRFDVTREQGVGRPYGYFADNKEYSENFTNSSQRGQDGLYLLYNCFLNIRNPFMAIGAEFVDKKGDAGYWIDMITKKLYYDKYKKSIEDATNKEQLDMLKIVTEQIGDYLRNVFVNDNPFWFAMAKDKNKEFKYFLLSHGFDGVRYTEEFKSVYDVNNPAEFTAAWTIFDASQVKLADGRNIEFNPMTEDIRYEEGGDTQSVMNDADKVLAFRHKIGLSTYAEGGTVMGDGKKTDDAKKGGYFVGRSHAEGGIKGVNKDTGQMIEVEGNEVIINKRSVQNPEKRMFENKMMTNREILSKINQEGGGVAFEEGGEITKKNCACTGKKYKFGGDLLSDYDIVEKIHADDEVAYHNQTYAEQLNMRLNKK